MANTAPIFARVPHAGFGFVTTANTAKDGTGTVVTVFTADATNGSYVSEISVCPRGTNVSTVMRVFLNNGSDPTVAANNQLIEEKTLSATTLSEVAALAKQVIPINKALPPGYRLNITIGTTVAAGFSVVAFGGDY